MNVDRNWVADARYAAEDMATRLLGAQASLERDWQSLLLNVLERAKAVDWAGDQAALRPIAADCETVGAYASEGLAPWCARVAEIDGFTSRYWKRVLTEGFAP